MGIKALTTSTLVPLSLIMGKDLFEQSVNYIVKEEQSGGNYLEDKIPLLDDDLIGNYLKISGLTTLSLSPHTLIPLGILMTLYHLNLNKQEGGTKLLTGASIPPNIFQNINDVVTGQDISHSPLRPLPYYNNEMQLNTFNDNYNGHINNLDSNTKVQGFPNYDISNTDVNVGIEHNNNSKVDPIDTSNISGNQIHSKDNNINLDVNSSMAGGGSDWMSTVYSRGPINSPTMSESQFRSFNQTSEYIDNSQLSGIDSISNTSSNAQSLSSHSTLYEMTPHDSKSGLYGGTAINITNT